MAVLGVMFVVLIRDWVPTDFALLFALVVVMSAQIVTTEEGLEGFSSSAVLTVAILYVVAAGINSTGALDYVFGKVLAKPKSLATAQLRLMFPVGLVSAFLNNTPVVAIMIPIVQRWARKINAPVSQLFIPLSFASILGGTCTLIGTSTNLVIAGKFEDQFPDESIGLFDLGAVGVPTLLTGFAYIILFSPALLPGVEELDRRAKRSLGIDENKNDGESDVPANILQDFTVACFVPSYSPVVGKAVDAAGLRGLEGLYLTSVHRGERLHSAIGPEFVINEGDILFFTGLVDTFNEFCLRNGFEIITDANEDRHISNSIGMGVDDEPDTDSEHEAMNESKSAATPGNQEVDDAASTFSDGASKKQGSSSGLRKRRNTFEERIIRVVVKSNSSLEGKTAKEIKFRKRYDAAILSLYRAGENVSIRGNLGRIQLEVGDVLLLVTGNGFSWEKDEIKQDLKPYNSNKMQQQQQQSTDDLALLNAASQTDLEREFLIPMRVRESPSLKGARSLVGQTVEAAGLRGLPGLFLVAVEHENGVVDHVVSPDHVLSARDMLWFAGEREAVGSLRRIPGLQSPDAQAEKLKVHKVHRRLVECVLSLHSNMVGKTVREAKFRTLYEAAIIAVHRQGRRVLSKIGEIELKAGDVLILDTGPNFVARYRDDPNFLLVTEIDDSAPPRFDKFYIALAATLAMLISFLLFSGSITLFEPAVFAAGIMIISGCLTPQRARAAVSWDVIVTIAAAFGLSNALENTGVANAIGNALVDLAEVTNTGFTGVLAAVYLATFLLSMVLSNNSAAVLMYEISITAAQESCPVGSEDRCLRQMIYVLMLSASSSFSTPYGYQTNLMVLTVGNYVFKDFLKFGLPMQFWQMVFSLIFVVFVDVWYISWLITTVAFVGIVVARFYRDKWKRIRSTPAEETSATEMLDCSSSSTESDLGNGTSIHNDSKSLELSSI